MSTILYTPILVTLQIETPYSVMIIGNHQYVFVM